MRAVVAVIKLWAPSVLCHYGRRYVDDCWKKCLREIKGHCARQTERERERARETERDFVDQSFSKLHTKVQLPPQRDA